MIMDVRAQTDPIAAHQILSVRTRGLALGTEMGQDELPRSTHAVFSQLSLSQQSRRTLAGRMCGSGDQEGGYRST
jgi:hypothetical protein